MSKQFLGRRLNHNTMMYEFRDGSGAQLPVEMEQEVVESGWIGAFPNMAAPMLLKIEEWKSRLLAAEQGKDIPE